MFIQIFKSNYGKLSLLGTIKIFQNKARFEFFKKTLPENIKLLNVEPTKYRNPSNRYRFYETQK